MKSNNKVLLAVDDSDASTRAVRYTADVLRKADVLIRILHVLEPLPPKLLEFSGEENPRRERQASDELQQRRYEWIQKAEEQAKPIIERAKSALVESGIAAETIEAEFWVPTSNENPALEILEVARTNGFGTVILGRNSFPWLREVFQRHAADEI